MIRLEDLLSEEPKKQPTVEDTIIDSSEHEIPDYFITDPQVVGYPDEEMQKEIYAWASKDVLPIVGNIDIVDIGAGRGDFGTWIRENYPNLNFVYDGFEEKKTLVEAGKIKGNQNIFNKPFAATPDELSDWKGWAFCIGSLNEVYNIDKWNNFFKILRHCLNWVTDGVVFILNKDDKNYITYPIEELLHRLNDEFPNIPFQIDYSNFNGIYKIVIYNKKFE